MIGTFLFFCLKTACIVFPIMHRNHIDAIWTSVFFSLIFKKVIHPFFSDHFLVFNHTRTVTCDRAHRFWLILCRVFLLVHSRISIVCLPFLGQSRLIKAMFLLCTKQHVQCDTSPFLYGTPREYARYALQIPQFIPYGRN
jgi:hypothetical protein